MIDPAYQDSGERVVQVRRAFASADAVQSMNTSYLFQPLAISRRWNAIASTLSILEWEMNSRGKIRPDTRLPPNAAFGPVTNH